MKNPTADYASTLMRAKIRSLETRIKELEELHFLDQSTIVRQRRQIEMLQQAAERKNT